MAGPKKKKGEYEPHGDISRIIPLHNNYCYITDEKGKLHHCKRDSDEFYQVARKINEVMNDKITRELNELGWEEQVSVLLEPVEVSNG